MEFIIISVAPIIADERTPKYLGLQSAKRKPEMKYKFRMFDADGVFYFEGVADEADSFLPMDWFGTNYGCTEIQYYKPELKKFLTL